jgi:subtilisin-like proprotein convertase family protein
MYFSAFNLTFRRPASAVALLLASFLTPAIAQSSDASGKPANDSAAPQISSSAREQIKILIAEKESRTPLQRKIGSSLIYKLQRQRGVNLLPGFASIRPLTPERPDGLIKVQITGRNTKALMTAVEHAGGKTVYGHMNGPLLTALVPLAAVETLAARSDVRGIREALTAHTQEQVTKIRTQPLQRNIASAIKTFNGTVNVNALPPNVEDRGSVVSQGVAAHRADLALEMYGATGAGISVGVISDSDDFSEAAIASGDLPPDQFTIPGQSGRPGTGEGTAMMEIVHDMAPAAKLFFASAFESPEAFADNIRQLRFTYHCDIIVDDVGYFFESPYQDDIVAHAVNDVVADGAMYFSAAGNSGNFDDGTSGTWEGDWKLAKSTLNAVAGYQIHSFGNGVIGNRVSVAGAPLILHWSDPGSLDNPQAADDYDLFVLDENLQNVLIASTDVQDGSEIPFEFIDATIPVGSEVVIVRHPGATDRAVRIELFGGVLGLATAGGTYGHPAAATAYAIAAVDAAQAGGGAFSAGPTTPVELFSTDGNRRVFFDEDGNAYKPGKFLFKNGGGQLRKKVDFAAADGVSTTLPGTSGLNPFFGTSAAAPHAASIAALMKSIKPNVKLSVIQAGLRNSTLDIAAAGRDVNSGYGIPDGVKAMTAIHAAPVAFLQLGTVTATPITGDGDPYIEPGESAAMQTLFQNVGGASTVNLQATLTTSTPGVTIDNGNSSFATIAGFGGTGSNSTPFGFTLAPDSICGLAPEFNLTTTYNSPVSPQTFDFKVQTGKPSTAVTAVPYNGSPVGIPDGNATGVNVPLTVSGFPGAISNLTFSIDGATCTAAQGATTVGIDHSWVGDLTATLTSPSGTTIKLFDRAGGINNSGNNFCQTVLDDTASSSIQTITIAGAPWTGSFTPEQPLATFDGEDPNGVWILHMVDNVVIDTGNVRAFSLHVTGFDCD